MSEVLTADQIASYEKNGYLILESHLPAAIIEARAEIERFNETPSRVYG